MEQLKLSLYLVVFGVHDNMKSGKNRQVARERGYVGFSESKGFLKFHSENKGFLKFHFETKGFLKFHSQTKRVYGVSLSDQEVREDCPRPRGT
jgi:hypothetical protein